MFGGRMVVLMKEDDMAASHRAGLAHRNSIGDRGWKRPPNHLRWAIQSTAFRRRRLSVRGPHLACTHPAQKPQVVPTGRPKRVAVRRRSPGI
jgi:hypothetical protein